MIGAIITGLMVGVGVGISLLGWDAWRAVSMAFTVGVAMVVGYWIGRSR